MIRSAGARKAWRGRCRPRPSRPSAPFSTNDRPPVDSATIVPGPSLLALTGVHRPSPSLFHLPGLRSLPFWTAPGPSPTSSEPSSDAPRRRHRVAFNDPVVAAAVRHVESNFSAIRSEYFSAVLGQGCETNPDSDDVAKPMEPDYDVAARGGEHAEGALHSGTWDWHSYILNGARKEQFRERCPKTAQVVDDLEKEGMLFGTPFGFCFFSTLHGRSSIRAHSGPTNLRLRMHLPLVTPSGGGPNDARDDDARPAAGMRVADQTREWHEGSAIVLDDSYAHEVWNDTEEIRAVLLLDLWHPDVRAEERERIANMFVYATGEGWIRASDK